MTATRSTPRQVARDRLTATIVDTARAHVAEHGAAQLSLRAVARDVGMVSSAIYRYFPSRDELLTALIIDAYDAIGEVAERARADVVGAGADHGTRWLAVCRAVRDWARRHREEWALVYGSPVVGYSAPVDTIEPAGRIARVLASLAADAADDGALRPPIHTATEHRLVGSDVAALFGSGEVLVFEDLPERALTSWIVLVGAINFELFGHLVNVVESYDGFFDTAMVVAGEAIGLEVIVDRA